MSLWGNREADQLHLKLLTIITTLVLCFTTTTAFAQNDDKIVIFHTEFGHLAIELFSNDAPNTVENFLKLAESDFYDNTIFHRIIKGFMIQGGDPNSKEPDQSKWGQGDAGENLAAEFNDIMHKRGIVSMARSIHPDSAGSQFFIVHKDSTHLDEQYTVFGRLVTSESYITLDKIANLEITTKDVPLELTKAEIKKTEVVTRSTFENTLTLDPPERIEISTIGDLSRYYNEEYKFSFQPQAGWMLQETEEPDMTKPALVALGISKDGVTPNITFQAFKHQFIKNISVSFEEFLQPRLDRYHELAMGDNFAILSEEYKKISGFSGLEIVAIQTLEDPIPDGSNDVILKFKQIFLHGPEFNYVITYGNHLKYFDEGIYDFDRIIDSFTVRLIPFEPDKDSQTITPEQEVIILDGGFEETEKGGCLIATATFGTEMAPQVQFLREIRDNVVLQTESGTSFMTTFNQFYYSFSPTIADYERENPVFKEVVKLTLTPLLTSLTLLQYTDIDTESEMLGYGIGVILLNIVMYFVAPGAFIMKIRKLQ